MAYKPELSLESSRTLRRISWALGVPMTKGIEFVFDYLPKILDRERSVGDAGINRNVQGALFAPPIRIERR